MIGTAFVHTVIDDHSRVAYAEIHDDETALTATGVLRRAVIWFAQRGVTTRRVLSDNGRATAAGLDWPDEGEAPAGQPPDQVYRIFGVEHAAEQLTWLQSQRWPDRRLLPNTGWRMPWPTGKDALDYLGLSIGTPFPWRQQMPLFHFDFALYTFVLAGEHEGEIWRYEVSPDAFEHYEALMEQMGAVKASLAR